jgi:hypothetical protein
MKNNPEASILTRTGGWLIFGLRPNVSTFQEDHCGSIDAPVFLTTGSTACIGPRQYTQVVFRRDPSDFPSNT